MHFQHHDSSDKVKGLFRTFILAYLFMHDPILEEDKYMWALTYIEVKVRMEEQNKKKQEKEDHSIA